jgi:peptidoglycan/LPS O-acetylase OafA/YrhL
MTALPEPATGRIRELDGVRGLAILLVLVWHYLVCEVGAPPPLFRILNVTWSGVDLFFVLSGFLIGGILIDHRDAPNYFSVFYRRRICRIFPLYYAFFLAFVLLRHRLELGAASAWLFERPMPLWSYATFTQNFLMAKTGSLGPAALAATWSLAIEEQFYLLLPIVIRFVPVRRLPYVLAPFIAVAPMARMWFYGRDGASVGWEVLLICKTDALLLGVVCAWLIRRYGVRLAAAASFLRIAFFSCLGFVALAQYVTVTPAISMLIHSFLAVGFAALILLVLVTPASPIARLTRVRWLRWLGVVSYGVYVIHELILGIVYGVARRDWPHFLSLRDLVLPAIALVVTLLVAAASYRWFERPILDIGRRWEYAKPSRPAAIPSAAPAAAPSPRAPPPR